MSVVHGPLTHLPTPEALNAEPAGFQQDLIAQGAQAPLRLVASRMEGSASDMALPLHERYPAEFRAYAAAMGTTFNVELGTLRKLGLSERDLDRVRNGGYATVGADYVHWEHRIDLSDAGTVYCLDPLQRGKAIAVDGNKVTIRYEVLPAEPGVARSKPCEHYRPHDAFAQHFEVASTDSGAIAQRYLGEPSERVKKARDQADAADAAFRANANDGAKRKEVDLAVRELRLAESHQAALREQYRIMRTLLGADAATEKWADRLEGLSEARLQEFREKAWLLSTPAAVAGLGITFRYESPGSK